MSMARVSDSVLQSADQLKTRLRAVSDRPAWSRLTRDVQFAVALRATAYLSDERLAAILAVVLESGEETNAPDIP
jgi:hypothetical protein